MLRMGSFAAQPGMALQPVSRNPPGLRRRAASSSTASRTLSLIQDKTPCMTAKSKSGRSVGLRSVKLRCRKCALFSPMRNARVSPERMWAGKKSTPWNEALG